MRGFPDNLEKVTLLAPSAVTLFVTNRFNTDPVNVTKMLLLSMFSFGIFGLIIVRRSSIKFKSLQIYFVSGFLIATVISAALSPVPFNLTFYGVDGRNTGILTYFSLAILFISATQIKSIKNLKFYNGLLFSTGLITVFYGLLQMQGFEFLDWNNVYNSALGTLGNPNFFASFVGMTVSALIPLLLGKVSKLQLFLGVSYILIALLAIIQSKSIQGLATIFIGGAVGIGIKLYFAKNRKLFHAFWLVTTIFSIFGVIGMLQVGPLSSIVYKPSVSLRGFYWHAGLEMFKKNWLFGVGPDAYGDWYRTYRSPSAILPPGGVDVNSNAAHNVFIDLAANSGLFALSFYLAILVFVALSAIMRIKSTTQFNPIYVSVVTLWVSYLAQSLISINQIGLAIWGWISSGLLLAPCFRSELINEKISNSKLKAVSKLKSKIDFSNFALGFGMFIGILVALPPFIADHNWHLALQSGKVDQFILAAKAEPINPKRMYDAVNILNQNKYYKEAREINKLAREYDPNFYYNWLMMYNITDATEQEKDLAKRNLKRLDPLNPQWSNQ